MKSLKLLSGLFLLLGLAVGCGQEVPPGTETEIADRLQPFGELCLPEDDCATVAGGADVATAGAGMTGSGVYDQFCATCHAAGIAGAPILGDAAAWEPRLAKGMDTLWEHTLNGFNAMPPKGTCMNCSDEELRSALDYIVGQVQ